MRYVKSKWMTTVMVLAASTALGGTIPPLVNYQGRLMDSGGMPVTGSVPATFALWDAPTGGSELWTESKAVEVSGGLYSVLLGDSVAIPTSVFSGSTVYLEVTVLGETLAPRERMTAVPYAFHADDSASLGGIPASGYAQVGNIDFSWITGTATDAQIPDNITINLAQNSTDLGGQPAAAYVLVAGDTVTGDLQINGTLHGHPDLNVSNNLSVLGGRIGVGIAPNPSQSVANSSASPPPYGAVLFGSSAGVVGRLASDPTISGTLAGSGTAISGLAGNSSSNSGMTAGLFKAESQATSTGVQAWATGDGPSPATAFSSNATNNNAGNAYGASFTASSPGTGVHYGTYSASYSGSSLQSYGIYALGYNSLGDSYGGYFTAQNTSSGTHYGIYSTASDYAGYFKSTNYGASDHYGLYAESDTYPGYFAWSTDPANHYAELASQAYGIYTQSGSASDGSFRGGGGFNSASNGPAVGVWATSSGSGSNVSTGVFSYGSNSADGPAYGGEFSSDPAGTGQHYGIDAEGYASSASDTYGVYGYAGNDMTGNEYGGYFLADTGGTGTHYGVYGTSDQYPVYAAWSGDPSNFYANLAWTNPVSAFGIYTNIGTSSSTNSTYGGYFQTTSQNTATGVQAEATGYGGNPTYGIYAMGINYGTGDGYGAYLWPGSASANAYGLYVVTGTKNWVNPDPEDPGKSIVYSTVESGENVTYFAGTARLVNGRAMVTLPDHFRKVTAANYPVVVQLTPESADSLGLAVVKKSNSSIEVVELYHGKGTYDFDYTVKGIRLGYEDYQPIINNVDYVPFQGNLSKLDPSKMTTQEFYDHQGPALKRILKMNGTLDQNGEVNEATFKAKGWKEVKVRGQRPVRD